MFLSLTSDHIGTQSLLFLFLIENQSVLVQMNTSCIWWILNYLISIFFLMLDVQFFYWFKMMPERCFILSNIEAANCSRWAQYAQHFWREWCCLCECSSKFWKTRLMSDNIGDADNSYNSVTLLHPLFQAEVRGFQHDGSLHLQARSQKYGKVCLV